MPDNTTNINHIIEQYQQDLQKNPSDAAAHHQLAMFYMQQQAYASALHHFHATINAAPNFIAAHYHLGVLLINNHEQTAAYAQFEQVITLDPDHISARFYLSAIQIQEQQLDAGAINLHYIITNHPEHVPSLINLGVIALKKDEPQIAITYFAQALALDENNIEARNNLAATFIHNDRFENALTHYNELLKNDPLNVEYLYNMGVANMSLGHLQTAIQQFETVLTQVTTHCASLHNLAAIKIKLGQRNDAINILKHTLHLYPNDSSSQFMLHALTNDNPNPHASHDYVKHLFNNYALHYESHLQNVLKYTLPQQIVSMLRKCNQYEFKHTLDLGCGTGLSGIPLREYSQILTGVDLSPKMLQHARSKNIYDHLIEKEIIQFLQADETHYDLILALDVLPYFGDLTELFTNLTPRLNGILVLSAEISLDRPWHIQNSMRFCHHPDYIKNQILDNNYEILLSEEIIARQENEQNMPVMVVLCKKINKN